MLINASGRENINQGGATMGGVEALGHLKRKTMLDLGGCRWQQGESRSKHFF